METTISFDMLEKCIKATKKGFIERRYFKKGSNIEGKPYFEVVHRPNKNQYISFNEYYIFVCWEKYYEVRFYKFSLDDYGIHWALSKKDFIDPELVNEE